MKLYTEFFRSDISSIPVVFLHGFTGSSQDWFGISKDILHNFSVYAIDLPGHGRSGSPDDLSFYTSEGINESLKEIIEEFDQKKIILAGYSMGGRAALNFAINYPDNIRGLILESTSPGIRDFEDRSARILNDEKIASLINSGTIEKFVDYWMNIPLFESQKSLPQEKLNALRASKLKNNKTGLANSLKGFGTGTMPVLWNSLKKISVPVLLITGEYDEKFTNINKEMSLLIRNSIHRIIPACGHNVHLEKPEHFLNLTNSFLMQIEKQERGKN